MKNNSRGDGNQEMSEVNTTPLIDVMLVLLVMMIVTLPAQTHLIKMNLPRDGQSALPPPTIYIDIDPDGTIVWDSVPLSGIGALEARLNEEAAKNPQAQIQLRPSALAKYDVVANVMASAQRHDIRRMGFTNIAEYGN